MISDVRRRWSKSVGGGESIGYIKDGLILHLDGINKGTNDGNWVDLIGGLVYENHGAGILEDGFSFNGNEWLERREPFQIGNPDNYTIEVVIKAKATTFGVIFTNGPQRYIEGLGYAINGDFLYIHTENNVNTTKYTFLFNESILEKKITSSVNYDIAVTNYLTNTFGEQRTFSSNNYSTIGARYWGSDIYSTGRFYGSIHCIRIYDRKLSKDEMLHNQQVDNNRFKLGLII